MKDKFKLKPLDVHKYSELNKRLHYLIIDTGSYLMYGWRHIDNYNGYSIVHFTQKEIENFFPEIKEAIIKRMTITNLFEISGKTFERLKTIAGLLDVLESRNGNEVNLND